MQRVFIFLYGAELPVFMQLHPKQEEPIVCADSGVLLVKRLSYVPKNAVLIGDFDSISPSIVSWCKRKKMEIRKYPVNKDMTDGHLAIAYACEKYPKDVEKIILGGVTGQLDHTLGNILAAVPFAEKGHTISFMGRRQRIYLAKGRLQIDRAKGHTISLIPLKESVVKKTVGLKWVLKNEKVSSYQSRTLRNYATQNTISIEVVSGLILVTESW